AVFVPANAFPARESLRGGFASIQTLSAPDIASWFAKAGRNTVTAAASMLAAVGVSPDVLVLRDAHRPRWARGLDQTAAIICDVLTAGTRTLPAGPRLFVFSLLADSARAELERIAASSHF